MIPQFTEMRHYTDHFTSISSFNKYQYFTEACFGLLGNKSNYGRFSSLVTVICNEHSVLRKIETVSQLSNVTSEFDTDI